MSAQQAASAVEPDHRSIYPGLRGLPWWGAVLLALTATAVGFAFDAGAGDKELTDVFNVMYILGCVTAVLAVAQSAVFTTVIQPPLLLFCTVPAAYWTFHRSEAKGLKGIAINCGYPLIERFPLMLFTSVTVLVIGLIRWYIGSTARVTTDGEAQSAGSQRLASALSPVIAAISAKLSTLLNRDATHGVAKSRPRRERSTDRPRRPAGERPRRTGTDRPRRTAAANRGARSASARSDSARSSSARSDSARSRHVRPDIDQHIDDDTPRPRRRRPPQDQSRRTQPTTRVRRESHPGSGGRPAARAARNGRSAESDYRPTERRSAEPPDQPLRRRRPSANGTGTHHPVSRVRYRGESTADAPTPNRRPERPTRPERSTRPRGTADYDDAPDDWRYDI